MILDARNEGVELILCDLVSATRLLTTVLNQESIWILVNTAMD